MGPDQVSLIGAERVASICKSPIFIFLCTLG